MRIYDGQRPLHERIANRISMVLNVPHLGMCWIWTHSLTQDGYARISFGTSKYKIVHKLSYEHFRKPVDIGMSLDHLCRFRNCVNPYHLEEVTIGDNIRRGTSFNGTKTHCKNGHEFTEDNTYLRKDSRGSRLCRKCDAARHRKYRS